MHLGQRSSARKPKWYQITRSPYDIVCPHCAKPVKISKKGQVWVLLVAPAMFTPLLKIFLDVFGKGPVLRLFSTWFFGLVLLAIVGLIATSFYLHLEKSEDE